MVGPGASAERRVFRELPDDAREVLEAGISPADLRTLLMAVARARAERVRPADVLHRWKSDRFVRPSPVDPRRLSELEAQLWRSLPADFVGVELSPVVPLGTCAAVASVSQNRIVTTTRGTEVVSDSTTALAVEAAARRLIQDRGGEVHLAAAHRQLRAQVFEAEGDHAHFRLFGLVSSARDAGTARTESRLIVRQIRYWLDVLLDLIPTARPRIELTCWPGSSVTERIWDSVSQWVAEEGLTTFVVDAADRTQGRGYYDGVALRISALDGAVDLGDGGLTPWTARLLGDKKERCFVSCVSTERLHGVIDGTVKTGSAAPTEG